MRMPQRETFFASRITGASARRRGLTLRLVRRSLHSLPACIRLAEAGVLPLAELATHTFPASQAKEAFDLVASYGDGALKVMVDMTQW